MCNRDMQLKAEITKTTALAIKNEIFHNWYLECGEYESAKNAYWCRLWEIQEHILNAKLVACDHPQT